MGTRGTNFGQPGANLGAGEGVGDKREAMTVKRDPLAELRAIHEELRAPCLMTEGSSRERDKAETECKATTEGSHARRRAEEVVTRAREREAVARLFLASLAMGVSTRLETFLRELDAAPATPPTPATVPAKALPAKTLAPALPATRTTTRVPIRSTPPPAALAVPRKKRA
jgi:hypothetical protein